MMSRSSLAVVVLALALLALAAAPVRAQYFPPSPSQPGAENIEGFTVSGRGTVLARPNRLEIDLQVSSASELTADAIVKYRDAKQRIQDAFRDLKLENVEVKERGLLVDQKGMAPNPYYWDYQPNQRTKTEVQLSRRLIVRCSEIGELDEDELLRLVARLLDVAQDAGGAVGGNPLGFNPYYYNPYNPSRDHSLVRFILDDFEALQEQAYEKAVADAKARASRLAKLSGVELGPIVAIREVAVPGESLPDSDTGEEPTRKRLESSRFQEIPIRVDLLVRFEVRPQPEGDDVAEATTR